MSDVRVFNGFVPDAFPAKHQSAAQMGEWRDRLKAAVPDLVTFENSLDECWMWQYVQRVGGVLSADHPNEPTDRYASPLDAVKSQCVLHQRFYWLSRAAHAHPNVKTWCWIEPTVLKQRGVTAAVIQKFVEDVAANPVAAISLPGVWDKRPVVDAINHWRFCGSAWVCPSMFVAPLTFAIQNLVTMRTALTQRLCWDNSTWSYLELLNVLPIRWYPGNHDETQFTGYLTGLR